MNDIVIVGSSGFANEIKVLIDRLEEYNFLGFIDNKMNSNVIGNDDFLINYASKLNVVIAIGDCRTRKKLFQLYKKNTNLVFPNVVDVNADLLGFVNLGQGNIVCSGSVITVDVSLGDFNIINLNCTVGHEVAIKNFVTVNPGVNISGDVLIEDVVNIGTGSAILQGKRIGENTTIGAGAVVVSDIPNDCTAVGIPAKIIKDRRLTL